MPKWCVASLGSVTFKANLLRFAVALPWKSKYVAALLDHVSSALDYSSITNN